MLLLRSKAWSGNRGRLKWNHSVWKKISIAPTLLQFFEWTFFFVSASFPLLPLPCRTWLIRDQSYPTSSIGCNNVTYWSNADGGPCAATDVRTFVNRKSVSTTIGAKHKTNFWNDTRLSTHHLCCLPEHKTNFCSDTKIIDSSSLTSARTQN